MANILTNEASVCFHVTNFGSFWIIISWIKLQNKMQRCNNLISVSEQRNQIMNRKLPKVWGIFSPTSFNVYHANHPTWTSNHLDIQKYHFKLKTRTEILNFEFKTYFNYRHFPCWCRIRYLYKLELEACSYTLRMSNSNSAACKALHLS